jgi:hypothetical protein
LIFVKSRVVLQSQRISPGHESPIKDFFNKPVGVCHGGAAGTAVEPSFEQRAVLVPDSLATAVPVPCDDLLHLNKGRSADNCFDFTRVGFALVHDLARIKAPQDDNNLLHHNAISKIPWSNCCLDRGFIGEKTPFGYSMRVGYRSVGDRVPIILIESSRIQSLPGRHHGRATTKIKAGCYGIAGCLR